jgi:hypothetical protein
LQARRLLSAHCVVTNSWSTQAMLLLRLDKLHSDTLRIPNDTLMAPPVSRAL